MSVFAGKGLSMCYIRPSTRFYINTYQGRNTEGIGWNRSGETGV